jgi:hypothetical protein
MHGCGRKQIPAGVAMRIPLNRCRIFLAGACLMCLCVQTGQAGAIDLFEGRVVLHGKLSNQLLMRARDTRNYELHDYNIFNARTSLKLEAMVHVYDGPEYSVNFYSVWKQFYDAAHDIDSDYKRYLKWGSQGTRGSIEQLDRYREFKDISRELFLEFNAPLFQVRLGKQIVSWGETGFERMVDNINPVDLRGNLNPAYPDFAEIKRGLWMARIFFTPVDHPMDLSYELLIIPDFEPTRLWPAGYHLNHPRQFSDPVSPFGVGFANPDEIYKAYYRDAPHDGWRHPEIGLRIRGFLAGFDWTLSYFRHRVDDGVLRPNQAMNQFLGAFFGRGGPIPGVFPVKNVYRYPWQETFGFTLNKPVDMNIPIIPGTSLAMSGNILRLEAIWERDKPAAQLIDREAGTSRITKQDRYAVCAAWQTKIFLPYITPWARNKYLSSTTQFFYEIMPDKKSDDLYFPWVTYAPHKKSWTTFTQELNYELWNGRILPGFYGAYYPSVQGGYWAPALGFKPQFRHTFMVRYINYFGLERNPANLNSKDFWTFEYTYEF